MAKTGWIKLHRQIMDSDFYKEPRKFSKFEAWLFILLNANYEEETKRLYGEDVLITAGSFPTSYNQLAQAWGWDKKTVANFLDYLVQEEMVTLTGAKTYPKSGSKKGTIIGVENWAFYQNSNTKTRTKTGTKTDPKKREPSYIDKEEKNILSLAEFVSMTKKEADKLIEEFGLEATKAMVEILNNYKGSSGKEYKSDYRAILSWVVKRYQEDKKKGVLFNDGNLYDPPH